VSILVPLLVRDRQICIRARSLAFIFSHDPVALGRRRGPHDPPGADETSTLVRAQEPASMAPNRRLSSRRMMTASLSMAS
jgi:hypothetical protein